MQLHRGIHFTLLVDRPVWDEYTPDFVRDELPRAVDTFTSALAQATASNKRANRVTEFWVALPRKVTISRSQPICDYPTKRNEFYVERIAANTHRRT